MSLRCLHWPPIHISFIISRCWVDLALTLIIFDFLVEAKVRHGDMGVAHGADDKYWSQNSDLFLTEGVRSFGICNQYMHLTSVLSTVYCCSLTSHPKFS